MQYFGDMCSFQSEHEGHCGEVWRKVERPSGRYGEQGRKPDLMDVRGDIVSDEYKKEYALPDGTLDKDKRKVSKKNIDNIFTPAVIESLEKTGKATIGTPNNSYYDPNGQEIKK